VSRLGRGFPRGAIYQRGAAGPVGPQTYTGTVTVALADARTTAGTRTTFSSSAVALAASGGRQTSDNFNRADGSLGSNWTAPLAGTDAAPVIVSNAVRAPAASAEYSAYWNADLFTGNHGAGVRVASGWIGVTGGTNTFFFGLSVTVPGNSFTGYIVAVRFENNGTQTAFSDIYRGNGGSYVLLDHFGDFAWAPGDRFSTERIGNRISLYRNGVLVTSVDDSSPVAAGGYVGLGIFTENTASIQLDDFLTSAGTAGTRKTTSSSSTALSTSIATNGSRKAITSTATALSAAVTTAGTRKTTGSSATALVAQRTTAGTRTTTSSSATSLTAAVTSAGARRVAGVTATALVAAVTTAGVRKATGAAAVALTDSVSMAGTRLTHGSVSVVLTSVRTTAGRPTRFAAASVVLVATPAAAGRRTAVGAAAVAETVGAVTSARRTTRSSTTAALSVTVTTAGIAGSFKIGASAVHLTAAVTTNGRRTARTSSSVTLTAAVTSAARVGARVSTQTSLAVAVVTSSRRKTFAAATVSLVGSSTVAGRAELIGSTAVSEFVLVTTDGVGLIVWMGASETLLTVDVTTAGRRNIGQPTPPPDDVSTPRVPVLAVERSGEVLTGIGSTI